VIARCACSTDAYSTKACSRLRRLFLLISSCRDSSSSSSSGTAKGRSGKGLHVRGCAVLAFAACLMHAPERIAAAVLHPARVSCAHASTHDDNSSGAKHTTKHTPPLQLTRTLTSSPYGLKKACRCFSVTHQPQNSTDRVNASHTQSTTKPSQINSRCTAPHTCQLCSCLSP
jgi:hypothetical protein